MRAGTADMGDAEPAVQYVRLGAFSPDEAPPGGLPCYAAVFEDGRIRILTEGIDTKAATRALAAAQATRRPVHILVGRPLGLAPDGATLLAVGFAQRLFAYTIDDVELMPALTQAEALPPRAGVALDRRMVA